MKRILSVPMLVFSIVISAPTFSSELPQVISIRDSSAMKKMGNVSVSAVPGSSDDAIKKLQEKAALMGGGAIRIISLGTPGDSSYWMGNAEVLR